MGVKIEHGGGKTGSAPGSIIASGLQAGMQRHQQDKQLAAQMLQQIASRAPAGRGGGGSGGGGGGGRKPEVSPADMAGWEANLARQASEQRFSQEMEAKQEQARLDTGKWKFEFSAKQKQEIARNNQAKQSIASARQRGELSAEEAQAMGLKVDMITQGMEASMVPDDSQKFPEGQGHGENWIDPKTGGLFRRGDKGESELLLKPSETAEGIERTAAAKIEQAERERVYAVEDAAIKSKADNAKAYMAMLTKLTKTIPGKEFPAEGDKPAFQGPDEQVPYSLTEIMQAMNEAGFGEITPAGQQQQQQAEMQQQQAIAEQQKRDFYDAQIERLPIGTTYRAPDGSLRKKRAPKRDFSLGKFEPWSEREQ